MTDVHNSIRIPPDSTGKRLRHINKWIVNYNNGTKALTDGDLVTFGTTNLSGTIDDVSGTVSSGRVGVIMGEFSVGTPLDGENILVDGVVCATVNGTPTENYYYPMNIIASGSAPGNVAEVDRYGSFSVRANEGDFQLGPTGRLKTGSELTLGIYEFESALCETLISTTSLGGGSHIRDEVFGSCKLSVTTAPGDLIQHRSNVYHLVQPNFPIVFSTLIQLGDTGKEGLRRRWGLFDENNGFYFELDNNILYACYRSNNSGSVVDTRIPQIEWNVDRVNGETGFYNRSGVTLDVSKINYYWIGISPSSGAIHFGIRSEQKTIHCNEIYWANYHTRPVVRNFSLPITWNMDTTAVVASSSEMNIVFGQVITDSENFDVIKVPRSFLIEKSNVGTEWTPLGSVRVKQLNPEGEDNRAWIVPHKLNLLTPDQSILYRVVTRNTLTGATWSGTTELSEYDFDATDSTGGIVVYSGVTGVGIPKVDTIVSSGELTPLTTKITRKADITEEPDCLTLEARTITGTTSVYLTFIQFEVS